MKLIDDFLTPFIARYDPKTDRILNCKEGTIFWHHENRHRRQFKDGLLDKTDNITQFALFFTIAFLTVQNFTCARLAFGVFLLFYAFFEVDATIYMIYAKFMDWNASR